VRSVKRKNPDACVALAGCAVESATSGQLSKLGIDIIVPREYKEQLVEIVLNALNLSYSISHASISPSFSTHRALLKIQDGCNFFCSYCIIPHNRGAPVTRSFDECLNEARAFIDQGFQEIVITGCNIACYDDQGRTLPEIVEAIAALPGIGRVRLGSVEPGTVELDLAEVIAESDKVCRFLHLPIQNCDDGVLKGMNRRYLTADIRRILDQILETVPDIALGSDIITGFPGESDVAFNNTKDFIREYPFSNLHVFPYSERRGTAAAAFEERVPHILRKERAQELIAIGRRKREQYALSWIGKETELLIEKFDQEGNACGWSGEYLPCRVSGINEDRRRMLLGKIISFAPNEVDGDVLVGKADSRGST
jgi:threonylcarbamoyladenosine tRNA methylthiotransferase MtaB